MQITTTSYHKVIIPVRIKLNPSSTTIGKYWYNRHIGEYFYCRLAWDKLEDLHLQLCDELYNGLCSSIMLQDCNVIVGDPDFPIIIPATHPGDVRVKK